MPVYSEVFTGPICHSQAHSFIRFASDTMQYRRRRDCCLLFNMFWSPVRSNDKFRPKSIQFAIPPRHRRCKSCPCRGIIESSSSHIKLMVVSVVDYRRYSSLATRISGCQPATSRQRTVAPTGRRPRR
jgi:hypothetical protein